MSTAHVAFCNDDMEIEPVAKSIGKYGDVKKVTIFNDVLRPESKFEKYTGTLYKYNSILFDNRLEYESIVDNIKREIKVLLDEGLEVFVNITYATPLQAFAARMATIYEPATVYFIFKDIKIDIPKQEIPQIWKISNAGLQVLRLLGDNTDYGEKPDENKQGKTQKDLEVLTKNGVPVSSATKVNAFKQLRSMGLIEEDTSSIKGKDHSEAVEGVIRTRHPGPVAKKWKLTTVGIHFYSMNKYDIPIIKKKSKNEDNL